jgi:hypothetical protein
LPGKIHNEEQILYALRQIEAGTKVSEGWRVNNVFLDLADARSKPDKK